MWANQLVFGSGTDVVTSEKPIRAKLPRLQAGFSSHSSEEAVNEQAISGPSKLLEHKSLIRHTTGKKKREVQNAETVESDASADDHVSMDGICQTGSDFDSFESSESEFEKEGIEMTAASFQPDLLAAHLAGYLAKDTSGAPVPLVPHLITMSMLPRTQWLNLVHLDTIKERNKPIEPPRKPEAAPFFLPTISHANAGRDVVFDELRKDKGDGDGDGDGNGKDDGDTGEKIMVLGSSHFGANGKLAGGESRFIKLLRQCSSAGDWTSLIGVLRDMSPVEIDQEIRSLQPAVFMEENGGEVADDDILLFLQFIESETASSTNFDFMQAILSSALSILGETLAERPVLRQAAARIEQRVNASWKRLDSTLQHVRCMVGLLGRLQ